MSDHETSTRPADHVYPWRIDYCDTDAGGVVYHSRYIDWAERARMQWLRDMGLNNRDLLENQAIAFAVRKLSADYRAPGRFDDALEIWTWVGRLGGASITLRQDIVRPDEGHNAVILVSLDLTLVCMKVSGEGAGKAARLPQALRDAVPHQTNDEA